MENLKKWINISLIVILVLVLIFYMIIRLGIKIELPETNKEYWTDNQLQENTSIYTTSSIIPGGVQTTINNASSGGSASPGETSGSSSSSGTSSQTIQTTIYEGCSIRNCEACENVTDCYNVGCVWCKVSERCLIICKG